MKYHQAGEEVQFEAQYPVSWFGAEYKPGDVITVGLVRDWGEEEGLGQGGPWGYGGYPSRLLSELSGSVTTGHAHTCLACGKEIEFGDFDCENAEDDADHDFRLCDQCAAEGIDLNA